MDPSPDSLASWATILGTAISLFGLIQSRAWITLTGLFFVAVSASALLYARKEHRLVNSATVTVDGRSLDSLNAANLARRRDRSLMVQKVAHVGRIEGEDLQITWRYAGYCRVERAAAIEFSIDADNNVPFDDLQCFAYDLTHDPDRKHRIRPLLVESDGISKKVAVPFLQPLTRAEGFDVVLRCELPGCMKAGVDYYSSTLSFDQPSIPRCAVRLIFVRHRPDWVRVYEGDASSRMKLKNDLPPVLEGPDFAEYADVVKDVAGHSTRVYVFRR
jgi:hypothetical protein